MWVSLRVYLKDTWQEMVDDAAVALQEVRTVYKNVNQTVVAGFSGGCNIAASLARTQPHIDQMVWISPVMDFVEAREATQECMQRELVLNKMSFDVLVPEFAFFLFSQNVCGRYCAQTSWLWGVFSCNGLVTDISVKTFQQSYRQRMDVLDEYRKLRIEGTFDVPMSIGNGRRCCADGVALELVRERLPACRE